MRSTWFAPIVVTTGQHPDLVAPIMELAGIEPHVDLEVGRPALRLNELHSGVISRLDGYCRDRFRATGVAVAPREQVRGDGFPAGMLVLPIHARSCGSRTI